MSSKHCGVLPTQYAGKEVHDATCSKSSVQPDFTTHKTYVYAHTHVTHTHSCDAHTLTCTHNYMTHTLSHDAQTLTHSMHTHTFAGGKEGCRGRLKFKANRSS